MRDLNASEFGFGLNLDHCRFIITLPKKKTVLFKHSPKLRKTSLAWMDGQSLMMKGTET